MPRIPEYNEQYRYAGRAGNLGGRLNPGDYGGTAGAIGASGRIAGQQWQQAGAALTKAADTAAVIYDDYNTTKAQQAVNGLQKNFLAWQSDMRGKKGEAGMDAGAQYEQWQKKQVAELTKGMSEIQRGRFNALAEVKAAGFRQWAADYGSEQGLVFRNAEDVAGIKAEADNLAANLTNVEIAKVSEDRIKDLAFTIAQRKGLGEEAAKALMRDSLAEAITPAIAAQIDAEKLSTARTALLYYKDTIGTTHALKLQAAIQAKGRELEARARADQERAERARVNSISNTAWENTKGLTSEERLSAGVEHIAALTDSPKEREKALQLFQANLKFQDTQEKSADLQAARQAVREGKTQQMPPTDFSVYLTNQVEMTERARNYAWADYMGNIKPDTKNRTELDAILVDIDSGKISQTREVEKRAMDGRLTSAQTDKALNYLKSGGKDGELSISSVNTLYKDMTKKKNAPVGLFDAVISVLPQGKKPTQEELRKAIANVVLTKGESDADALFFTQNESYSSALKSGRGDKWLPEVTAEENKKYAEILRRKGLPATDKNIRLYKKEEMGIPLSGKE